MPRGKKDIREILKELPHHCPPEYDGGASRRWLDHPKHYPFYEKIASILDPRSILEVGTLVGYSLISMVRGSKNIEEVTWTDNEMYCQGSNLLARWNLSEYMVIHEPNRLLGCTYAGDREAVMDRPAELVHIDGDHSYEAVMYDLRWVLTNWLDPIILLDDAGSPDTRAVDTAINEIVNEFGLYRVDIPSMNGFAILFPKQPEEKILKKLEALR